MVLFHITQARMTQISKEEFHMYIKKVHIYKKDQETSH